LKPDYLFRGIVKIRARLPIGFFVFRYGIMKKLFLTVGVTGAAVFLFFACENMSSGRDNGKGGAAVRRVTVNPQTAELGPGEKQQFTATVEGDGTGTPSQSVIWTLSGEAAAGTAIDRETGVLGVAADEQPGREFTVTATSVFDTTKTASGKVKVVENALPGLAGTFWFWSSLQLYFISENRVMLTSADGYYPFDGSPFQYTCPAQGYAYSYTYDPAAKTGSIKDLKEYTGGGLLAFEIPPDRRYLHFPNYKGYGHSADFAALRPPPPDGFTFTRTLPASPSATELAGTIWMGTIPGTDITPTDGTAPAPGIDPARHPIVIYFDSATRAYITRTCDVDTEAEKQREFGFTCTAGTGIIDRGIGAFTVQSAANTITFAAFPGSEGSPVSVTLERIR
jgi:hypothetical protein